MANTGNLVQSVERALDLLEAVAAAGEIGVSELARELGLHVATVHNLLRTLATRHFLLNHNGRYRLGPAAGVLASRWDPVQALPDILQPKLVRVARESGEAASATILLGFEARLIAFQPGTEAITIHFPQWSWPQALKLATGRLLVACGDEAAWPAFVERSPDTRPGCSLAAWQADLRRVRALGYCALRTDRDGGQVLLALPVVAKGAPVASIGVACPAFRADGERCARMTAALWSAAVELSAELGGELPGPMPVIDWATLPLDPMRDEMSQSPFGDAE
ncbi:MAG: helix-turn-helix domain-containing protein [Armatimonadetes bacterium]|nr:helix-turn-helix domain-containing protein [Armatimonadota bacterium]